MRSNSMRHQTNKPKEKSKSKGYEFLDWLNNIDRLIESGKYEAALININRMLTADAKQRRPGVHSVFDKYERNIVVAKIHLINSLINNKAIQMHQKTETASKKSSESTSSIFKSY